MKKRNAFTLIELLVVIGIIGLLAGIMIPAVSGAMDALTRTKTKSRFNEWVTAVKQYKLTDLRVLPDAGADGFQRERRAFQSRRRAEQRSVREVAFRA